MYQEYIYDGLQTVEHSIFYKGEYGSRGERRGERIRTKEEMDRWNHSKKVKHLRRLIQANFIPGDLFITLKYPKGYRASMDEVVEHFKRFRDRMRKYYKEQGMKYVYVIEIGKRGGIHIHMIINQIDDALRIMTREWSKARRATPMEDMLAAGSKETQELVRLDGKVDLKLLYLEGAYNDLAEYMCKHTLGDEYRYGTSRNMIRPEPVKKTYTRRTMRKMIEAGAEKINTDPALRKRYLRPGYIIDRSTWHTGINPVTGLSFLEYAEVKVT